MAKVWSIEELKAQRRQGTVETAVPFVLDGKVYEAPKKIVNGEIETFDLGKPIGEMLTNETARKELVRRSFRCRTGTGWVPVLYSLRGQTQTSTGF